MEGIILKNGDVIGDDGKTYFLPGRGTDGDGYPEVLMDAKSVGGSGSFRGQSIKPFIGMRVSFVIAAGNGSGYNYVIIENSKTKKNKLK